MIIPGEGQLTALAFTAAIDDPSRFWRSRDLGAYLGRVLRRYQSSEIGYVGGISKVGDKRVRTLLYEAANVVLTRCKGALKLRDWALADDAQGADRTRPPSYRHHARHAAAWHRVPASLSHDRWTRQEAATNSRAGATPEGGSG